MLYNLIWLYSKVKIRIKIDKHRTLKMNRRCYIIIYLKSLKSPKLVSTLQIELKKSWTNFTLMLQLIQQKQQNIWIHKKHKYLHILRMEHNVLFGGNCNSIVKWENKFTMLNDIPLFLKKFVLFWISCVSVCCS